MQCKTQMRKPCRGRGKEGLLQTPHFLQAAATQLCMHLSLFHNYASFLVAMFWLKCSFALCEMKMMIPLKVIH